MRLWTPEGALEHGGSMSARAGPLPVGFIAAPISGCRRSNTAATSAERWIGAARRIVRQTHVGARRPHRLRITTRKLGCPTEYPRVPPGARQVRQPRRHDRFVLRHPGVA